MPHTKQDIQELLDSAGIRPRHRWGQNFLIDLNLMRMLVDRAGLSKNDTVLEVGTGTGSMTDLIAQAAGKVITVEIDPYLQEIAGRELACHEHVEVVPTDVLANKNNIAPAVLEKLRDGLTNLKGKFCLVANLPYQAGTPLMINLLLGEYMPAGMYVTIQAEVGDRMIAKPGDKAYGLLSILMQATGKVEKLKTLGPQLFWPAPKVHSAMIVWEKDEAKCNSIRSLKHLKDVIDMMFRFRRKKIKSCIDHAHLDIDFAPILDEAGIDENLRGENLTADEFIELANLWAIAEEKQQS